MSCLVWSQALGLGKRDPGGLEAWALLWEEVAQSLEPDSGMALPSPVQRSSQGCPFVMGTVPLCQGA